jgi:hypothetical protein
MPVVIEWKAPEQKHPLKFKAKPDKKTLDTVPVNEVEEGKISRKFTLSQQPLDDTGQLYFEIVDRFGAGLFWHHLLAKEGRRHRLSYGRQSCLRRRRSSVLLLV